MADLGDDPIEFGYTPVSFPKIPAEMIQSLALGAEDELVIAARHGFSVEKYQELSTMKPFRDAVAAQRAEFDKSGLTFRVKQAMKADILWDEVFVAAMSNETTLLQKLEVAKHLAKLGNLEPKDEKQQVAGTGFTINIDLGDRSVQLGTPKVIQPLVLDAEPNKIEVEDK